MQRQRGFVLTLIIEALVKVRSPEDAVASFTFYASVKRSQIETILYTEQAFYAGLNEPLDGKWNNVLPKYPNIDPYVNLIIRCIKPHNKCYLCISSSMICFWPCAAPWRFPVRTWWSDLISTARAPDASFDVSRSLRTPLTWLGSKTLRFGGLRLMSEKSISFSWDKRRWICCCCDAEGIVDEVGMTRESCVKAESTPEASSSHLKNKY